MCSEPVNAGRTAFPENWPPRVVVDIICGEETASGNMRPLRSRISPDLVCSDGPALLAH